MQNIDRNDKGLPADFDTKLADLRDRRRRIGEKRFAEIIGQISDLSYGEDPDGISRHYPGWTESDYKALIAALNRHANEDWQAGLKLEQERKQGEVRGQIDDVL